MSSSVISVFVIFKAAIQIIIPHNPTSNDSIIKIGESSDNPSNPFANNDEISRSSQNDYKH